MNMVIYKWNFTLLFKALRLKGKGAEKTFYQFTVKIHAKKGAKPQPGVTQKHVKIVLVFSVQTQMRKKERKAGVARRCSSTPPAGGVDPIKLSITMDEQQHNIYSSLCPSSLVKAQPVGSCGSLKVRGHRCAHSVWNPVKFFPVELQ